MASDSDTEELFYDAAEDVAQHGGTPSPEEAWAHQPEPYLNRIQIAPAQPSFSVFLKKQGGEGGTLESLI
ncbi:UNVERIFIED_CONTAM: hypothetical protein K2H54_033427 [Gekko kuhli]